MKKELNYQLICQMLQSYDAATGNRGADHVIKNPREWVGNPYQPFYADAARLLLDLQESMETVRVSDKSALSVFKRIIKRTNSPSFKGITSSADESGNPCYCVCDSYILLRLKRDFASLPHTNLEHPATSDSIRSIMRTVDKSFSSETSGLDLSEVKRFIAEQKAKHQGFMKSPTPYYFLGSWFNPLYLLDVLEALPGCTFYKPSKNTVPMYFASEDGDGILCPVRVEPDRAKELLKEQTGKKAA